MSTADDIDDFTEAADGYSDGTNLNTSDLSDENDLSPFRETLSFGPKSIFKNSEVVHEPTDSFGINVFRGLKASLSLHEQMKDIKVQIVVGGNTNINVYFQKDQRLLKVHAKWFDFTKSHEISSCMASHIGNGPSSETETFACDHIVKKLVDFSIMEIWESERFQDFVMIERSAHRKIRSMPRLITASIPLRPCEIQVDWIGNERALISREFGGNIMYYVVLHTTTTCQHRREDLVYHTNSIPNADSSSDRCTCPHQEVSLADSMAIFKDLDPTRFYFPMVSRLESKSFFGVPPAAIRPFGEKDFSSTPRRQVANPRIGHEKGENTPRRRGSRPRYGQVNSQPQSTDVIEQWGTIANQRDDNAASSVAYHEDLETWRLWQNHNLPETFSQLISERESKDTQDMGIATSANCLHLQYTFETGDFAKIRLQSVPTAELIVFIHEIRHEHDGSEIEHINLLVTRYSFLRTSELFKGAYMPNELMGAISTREVILHFKNFDAMGTKEDAEVIALHEVVYASNLDPMCRPDFAFVQHALHPPSSADNGYFCRFAIRSLIRNDEACITPLASHLLRHQDRWKRHRLIYPSSPRILDFTPGILGPIRGFQDFGWDQVTGIGLNYERDFTWMNHSNSPFVYDGDTLDICNEFICKRLTQLISLKHAEHLKIALITGGNSYCRLKAENRLMVSQGDFLKPLSILDISLRIPSPPSFIVMAMPAIILHPSMICRFFLSILRLMEQRKSVHLKLVSCPEFGIPQDRNVLVLIASPLCAAMPWDLAEFIGSPNAIIQARTVLADLLISTPRVDESGKARFMYTLEIPMDSDSPSGGKLINVIYNHQTGRTAPQDEEPIDIEKTKISLQADLTDKLVHPTRRDCLTVREIARLQGFRDDYMFLGPLESQYEDVRRAFPPSVMYLVAKTIDKAISQSKALTLNSHVNGQRQHKRPRLESENTSLAGPSS